MAMAAISLLFSERFARNIDRNRPADGAKAHLGPWDFSGWIPHPQKGFNLIIFSIKHGLRSADAEGVGAGWRVKLY